MQNNENRRTQKQWKEKGYYILLVACLLAVGISGSFFLAGMNREQQAVEESLAMPVAAPTQEDPEALKRETMAQEPAPTEPALAELPEPEPLPPVEDAMMPVSGAVIQDYAMDHLTYNRTTQDWRVHNGVDLAAPLGEEVRAAKSGTVTAVYEDEYLGMTVVLEHPEGCTSHYCNLAADPAVSAGQTVRAGDVLGTIGDTALLELSQEPHLHFEVYRDGQPVDPAGFLY